MSSYAGDEKHLVDAYPGLYPKTFQPHNDTRYFSYYWELVVLTGKSVD
jgi:hypothetical protein